LDTIYVIYHPHLFPNTRLMSTSKTIAVALFDNSMYQTII